MLAKIFILILLGTYVLTDEANDIQKETEGWRKDVQETMQDYYEQSKKAFEETVNELKRRTSSAVEMSRKKFSELKEKYDNMQSQNESNKEDKTWEDRIQELKDQTAETLKSVNERYEQLKKKTQDVIQKQQEMWQGKIKELIG